MDGITFEEASIIPPSRTFGEAVRTMLANPALFVSTWNYKGAVLSGLARSPIFLVTYLMGRESLSLAVGAALLQFAFRFAFAGVGGTLIQAFRSVEPAWKAMVAILFVIPLVSHLLEFALQSGFAYMTSTEDHTGEAILRSITVSVIAALFTLFAMRRGVMTVGEEDSKSFLHDIGRLPRLVFEFIFFIPNEIAAMLLKRAYVQAVLGIIGFGMFSHLMLWAVSNRFSWTYAKGRTVPLLQFWGVDAIVLLIVAVVLSLLASMRYRVK